ncbi:MAG: hypothetical protein ABMA64_29090 [Myxococcota bacterium]
MPPFSDTSPEAHRREVEYWRAASPEEKWAAVGRLNGAVLELCQARQDMQYPDATPEERRLRLCSLWVDRDTMIHRFGWDPLERGR